MTTLSGRRDKISDHIQTELFKWLEDTAATATSEADFVDLYAGAIAGVSRFLWVHRKEGVAPETIVTKVAGDVREFFAQASEHERRSMS